MTQAWEKDKADLVRLEGVWCLGMQSPVDLQVLSGQIWMVSGPSGTGKSQLLKALADLIPHQGQAWLKGESQQLICPDVWRAQVMYFAAETAWWLETVAAHFKETPSAQYLESLGLSMSIMQKHPDECSSGEKQRLALLRGLAVSPKVLLLDEITANLDPESTQKVEALLRDYVQQSTSERAIIWVSHDVSQRQRMAPEGQQLILNHCSSMETSA